MNIKNVVVVGGGMMGNALAMVFASAPDLHVTLKTRKLRDDRWDAIINNFDIMIARGAATEQEKKDVMSRIHFEEDEAKAYTDADFIIECAPEVMETKQNLFAGIENYCSDKCILATNTSVMSPTEISEKCKHRERVVGAHFWNPGHLIPLVEVVKSNYTSDEVMDATMALMTKVGKKPIYCKKDVPGFVANRLQHALWREAFYMVENGIADAKTVDDACKYGPGLRWPVMGPMENSDVVGIQLSQEHPRLHSAPPGRQPRALQVPAGDAGSRRLGLQDREGLAGVDRRGDAGLQHRPSGVPHRLHRQAEKGLTLFIPVLRRSYKN